MALVHEGGCHILDFGFFPGLLLLLILFLNCFFADLLFIDEGEIAVITAEGSAVLLDLHIVTIRGVELYVDEGLGTSSCFTFLVLVGEPP